MAPCSAIMVEVATVIAGFPFQSASLLRDLQYLCMDTQGTSISRKIVSQFDGYIFQSTRNRR